MNDMDNEKNVSEAMAVQWFPGHMASTRRRITEDLKQVDVVAELLDARVPRSSQNPMLQKLAKGKPKVVLLNKSDMADPNATARWVEYYAARNVKAVGVNCKTGKGMPAFYAAVREAAKEKIQGWEQKGMTGRPIRVMVVGIPNVGKSSLINRLAGARGKAKVQDRPGVTRQNQWFTVEKGLELLDTPGILWPKFEDPVVGEHLAFTGAVRDEILDREGLACRLLELLSELYPQCINQRYKTDIDPSEHLPGYELLERVGRRRGMLISGGEIDTERAAATVLDEYRGGLLGRITLEQP